MRSRNSNQRMRLFESRFWFQACCECKIFRWSETHGRIISGIVKSRGRKIKWVCWMGLDTHSFITSLTTSKLIKRGVFYILVIHIQLIAAAIIFTLSDLLSSYWTKLLYLCCLLLESFILFKNKDDEALVSMRHRVPTNP